MSRKISIPRGCFNTGKIKLSQEILLNARVIAKGRRIRNLQHLLDKHGGIASKWVKKSSAPFEIEGDLYEYHWYKHHGIGRFEIKLKKVKQL
ncbi:hypothetical protein H8E88_11375 [candidate division KSB1 bacterium]|nr:hypothetical protein [candidate division KSB1 bacterium]MBL7093635.1 hypothetical protein [candidate division KSB1 bacterium]